MLLRAACAALQAVCGQAYTLALVDDGALAAFGDNEHGQTGVGAGSGTQVGGPTTSALAAA